jgi:hypothetical protein
MMYIVQVRLMSEWLGELKPDHKGVRRFKTTRDRRVDVNARVWQDQFSLAARNLQLDLDIRRTFIPPSGIVPASIHKHLRRYSKVYEEIFESFRKGTIITFDLMIRDDLPKHPEGMQLKTMFSFVGRNLGLSQFGNGFGYGRFELVNIRQTAIPSELLPGIAWSP